MTFIFHNIWDNPSHWLIFFREVETTNQETDYELSGCISNLQSSWTTGGFQEIIRPHDLLYSYTVLWWQHHIYITQPEPSQQNFPNKSQISTVGFKKIIINQEVWEVFIHQNKPWNYHPGHVFLGVTNWVVTPFFSERTSFFLAWTSPTFFSGTSGSVGWSSTYTPCYFIYIYRWFNGD